MVTRDPDMTRLLDRLEARGLVMRARPRGPPGDYGAHHCRGIRLSPGLDTPVTELQRQLGRLGERRLRTLSELLQVARE
jgi:hypothetical protein